jgi:hypothetical protein
MATTFANQLAAMIHKVTNKIATLHGKIATSSN